MLNVLLKNSPAFTEPLGVIPDVNVWEKSGI